MKKLLYIITVLVFTYSSSFSQVACPAATSVEFQNVPTNTLVNGQTGFFNVKASIITGSPGQQLYFNINSISATGGTHTNNTPYTYSGQGTGQGTVNFTVNSPNPTGSETFIVTLILDNNGTPCQVTKSTTISTTPVQLLSFSGKQTNNGGVNLKWTTATERENAFFKVERSNNGTDFTPVAEVKGAGSSVANVDYNYFDVAAVKNSVNYYRLTDVAFDGTQHVSNVIAVNAGKNSPLTINNFLSADNIISINSPSNGDAEITIANTQGQVVTSQKALLVEGSNEVFIRSADLTTGIYIVNVVNNAKTAQYKFFKN